jgi:hypothetical protein
VLTCQTPWVGSKHTKLHIRKALMKVKSFFYAHSTSDSDRKSVLGLEKSYFESRSKVCTKQTSMKDFLSKK